MGIWSEKKLATRVLYSVVESMQYAYILRMHVVLNLTVMRITVKRPYVADHLLQEMTF